MCIALYRVCVINTVVLFRAQRVLLCTQLLLIKFDSVSKGSVYSSVLVLYGILVTLNFSTFQYGYAVFRVYVDKTIHCSRSLHVLLCTGYILIKLCSFPALVMYFNVQRLL